MRFPHERLAADPHDRVAVRRDDEAWLAARWADPTTRVLVVVGNRIRPEGGAVAWVAPQEVPGGVDGIPVLLGERDGATYLALLVRPEDATGAGFGAREDWIGLRALFPGLAAAPSGSAPLAFHALGIAEWHHATRHCTRCGGPLTSRRAGHELVCDDCGRSTFPRQDPAVIMAITHGEPGSEDEACLLGRNAAWPAGRYSTLAGFCEPGESLEDAVRREVGEETGVAVGEVTYFGSQGWPLPSSLMVGFVGRALTREIDVDGDEIEDARWWTRAQLKAEAESGELVLPGGISISRGLIEHWYGGPLPGQW